MKATTTTIKALRITIKVEEELEAFGETKREEDERSSSSAWRLLRIQF